MPLHRDVDSEAEGELLSFRPQYALGAEVGEVPRHRLPDEPMEPRSAYQVVHDELMLDGNARLNLATFVSTWMEPEAERLMAECFDKNIVDKDEYPMTAEIERRCVAMIADLWNGPADEPAVGCSTTGSSEAAMLGGLALLQRWRKGQGASAPPGTVPNLVMGANVQVCWEKFCRYFGVEAKLVPVAAGRTGLGPKEAAAAVDGATIGVVAVLGSTFDGIFEPVAEIASALDKVASSGGPDVPVHVDAASGGFVAPFLDPDLVWDFRLKRVQSINASGHKYGLVYPGVGWALWRNRAALPDELVFDVDYLGGSMPTFSLNFSRPGAQVIGQYYNFLRLGREGYREVQQACRDTARWLAGQLGRIDGLDVYSDGSQLPVVTVVSSDPDALDVFELSGELRRNGWLVPAYHMPPDLEEVAVLRVVVRNGLSRDLAEALASDVEQAVGDLRHRGQGKRREPVGSAFHH
jgi:glutamate decarboxylase